MKIYHHHMMITNCLLVNTQTRRLRNMLITLNIPLTMMMIIHVMKS